MAKLDVRIIESGKDSLIIEKGGRSRLLYLIIFILLSTTVFLSLDPAYDFSSSRIGGTIFTFVLILISLAVTLIVRSVKIDKSNGIVETQVGLPFRLYSKSLKTYALSVKSQIIVKSISYNYADSNRSRKLGIGGSGLLKKRRSKVTLCIETSEDTVIICDGSSKEEIHSTGVYISKYFGFPLRNEG